MLESHVCNLKPNIKFEENYFSFHVIKVEFFQTDCHISNHFIKTDFKGSQKCICGGNLKSKIYFIMSVFILNGYIQIIYIKS